MDNIRRLLHKNVLKTNLADFQINLLEKIDLAGEASKWCMFESVRGSGTSYLLAAYAYEKAFLYPGIKICIVGAGFRQSKILMEYIDKFNIVSKIGSSVHDVNEWKMRVNESLISARPIGDGSKICGARANILIFPNFISIPKDIFETIIGGHGVSSTNKDMPQNIVISETGDIDFDSYEEYNKYRKTAISNDCLIKVKREDLPEGWLV